MPDPSESTGLRATRWRSPLAVLVMVLVTVGVGLPVAIAVTPSQGTTVAGQFVGVGAGTPTLGWLGDLDDPGLTGPARLEQIGNTTVDLRRVEVRGPMRPRLELGPLTETRDADDLLDPDEGPSARAEALESVTSAFVRWYAWASVALLTLTLLLLAVLTGARTWGAIARASRRHRHLTVAEVWHGQARRLQRDAALALVVTVVAWGGVSWAAYQDTRAGLSGVMSLRDLVGAVPVRLEPAGPPVEGYAGAVIGDSRASRLGGPPVADAGAAAGSGLGASLDQEALACARSTDSLAAQLTLLDPDRPVLNLACPSATVDRGLLGEQQVEGLQVTPQVARLLQLDDLEFVVVMVGPNDLAWSDFLRYCYGVEECDDAFTSGQFDYRLAAFDRAYGDLLAALAALPGSPRVVVVGAYDLFDLDADCPATAGPEGVPGLDEDGLALLAERGTRFDQVLVGGAAAYGFSFVSPRLAPLCGREDPTLGPDLQDLESPYPFHPTGVGMVRLGAAVFAALTSSEAQREPAEEAGP